MDKDLIVKLEEVKNYLRIDFEDDDNLLTSLIIASKEYIYNATGIEFDSSNELASLCAKLLVANWYTNRTPFSEAKGEETPYAIKYLITQLKFCGGNN